MNTVYADPDDKSTGEPRLLVLPSPYVVALRLDDDGEIDLDECQLWSFVPAHEAFTRSWEVDAHVAMYDLPGERVAPRLRKSTDDLGWLAEQGLEPRFPWFFVDVDTPGHSKWGEGTEAEQAERAAWLDSQLAIARALTPRPGIYTGSAGFRLVWRLEPALDAPRWEALARKLVGHLAGPAKARALVPGLLQKRGIPADPACSDWTRLFRLPRVVRDDVPLEPTVMGLDDIGVIDTSLLKLEPVQQQAQHEPPRPGSRPPVRVAEIEGDRLCIAKAMQTVDHVVERVRRQKVNGDRNKLLHWAACRVGEVAGWIDVDAAGEALVQATLEAGLKSGEGEARRTVASGISRGEQEPRDLRTEVFKEMSMLRALERIAGRAGQ